MIRLNYTYRRSHDDHTNQNLRILMIVTFLPLLPNICKYIFVVACIQVAWIKADTKAILAIHEHVITNNERLSVTHNDYNTWTLNVRTVRREDRGTYMCQVNTDPMKSQVISYICSSPPPDFSTKIVFIFWAFSFLTPERSFVFTECFPGSGHTPRHSV